MVEGLVKIFDVAKLTVSKNKKIYNSVWLKKGYYYQKPYSFYQYLTIIAEMAV